MYAQIAAAAVAIFLGQVRDRTTGQPLPSVSVEVGGRHARTDSAGRFRIAGLRAGPQQVTVTSKDVPTQVFHVTVKEPSTRSDLRVCSTTLDYDCSKTIAPTGNG